MSNLLEKASIITTPTAYSDGKLHSVKPVQTLSDELVVNGDFATDSDWFKSGQVTIGNGVAYFDSDGTFTQVAQNLSNISGKNAKVVIEITEYTQGTLKVLFSGGAQQNLPTSVGTHTLYFSNVSSNTINIARVGGVTNIKIDNVSVKEVIDADFDFQRGSAATRVNSQGLIENVQILSGNLVQNGDFSEIGSELVTNGDFTGSSAEWNESGTWTYGNNNEVCTGNGTNQMLTQSGILTSGKFYTYSLDIISSTLSSQEIRVYIGGNDYITHTLNGGVETITGYKVSAGSNLVIRVTSANTSGILTIDNVSVKEVGQNWSFGGGWSIGDGKAISNGIADVVKQTNVGGAGATAIYKVQWTQNITVGTRLRFFARNYNDSGSITTLSITRDDGLNIIGGNCVGSGTFTAYVSSTNGYSFKILSETGVEADITNISAIEITDDTDLPRIDYTDGCGSLLLEPQSTNLITYSEDFSQGWIFNSSVIVNQAISPSGDNTANELPNSLQRIAKNSVSTINTDNTISLYVKLIDSDYFLLSSYSSPTDWVAVTFDITNGTITNQGIGSGSSVLDTKANIEKVGNGYCRISIVNNTSASAGINLQRVDNPTHSYTNYGVASDTYANGYAYIWGAQVEQLSFPTSYIPTNGSTATRLADVCNNAGSSDLINSTEGVLYAEIKPISEGVSISLSDGTISNRVSFYYQNGIDIRGNIRIANSQVNISGGGNISDAYHKIALRWDDDTNILTFYKDGSLVGSVSYSGSLGANTLNNISFTQGDGTSSNFYGKNKAVAVFPYLTNDELEGLTGEGYDTFNALALANNYTII